MNIDDQAELAFEHHIDNYGIDWGSNCELFTAGYRAALRNLYVEVKPEDLQEGGIYHARWADQPVREVYYDGEQLCYWEVGGVGPNGETEHIERNISPEDCEVREFVLPSPSSIFGEGV